MRIFLPTERFVAAFVASLFALDALLIAWRAPQVDWAGYAAILAVGLGVTGLGIAYRVSGRDANIALAAVTAGLFILFTIAISFFNYMLLPVGERRIDELLIRVDALFGYSWPDFVAWMAGWPELARLLGYVYMSSLGQFVVLILVLGMSGRAGVLHRFLLTGLISVTGSILFWFVWPSSGPAAYFDLPVELVAAIGMVVGPDYGAELNRLALEGPGLVSPRDVLGLVAFPSVHTVMALMAIWFARPLPALFVPFLIVNVAMMPAILAHGGHHLVDLFAGAAMFALSVWLAGRIARRLEAADAVVEGAGEGAGAPAAAARQAA